MKTAILPCSLNKGHRPGPAAEVYHGNLFRLALTYAERFCDQAYIISLKYGLIKITDWIEPYDILPREDRRFSGGSNYRRFLRDNQPLAETIRKQLNELPGILVYLCANELVKLGPPGETPLQGMDLIRRKKWLNKELSKCPSL